MTVNWQTPPYASEGLLLDEEEALKAHLSGMIVRDLDNNTRPVPVYFAHPDKEKRDQTYPYGVITLVDLSEDRERTQSGRARLSSIPDDYDVPTGGDYLRGDYPVPLNLDYQVQFYSRNPRHSRHIVAQFVNRKVPLRGCHLKVDDGTYRRISVLGVAHRETAENNKRLFATTFTLRVSAETEPNNITAVAKTPTITDTVVDIVEGVPPVPEDV